MIESLACPVLYDLERLALGQLPDAEAEQLSQHIMSCSSCAERLDSLQAAHPLAAELRALGPLLPAVSGADELVERLVGTGRTNSDVQLALATKVPGVSDGQQPPTKQLGRYRILSRLGAGGMGVVYRGHDPQLGRDVAIKLPNFRGAEEEGAAARQRFLREARAAAAVRHAHVCPIYDVGEEQGRPYVVMALVEGETLADRLRRQGRFDEPREAVDLVLRVAEALSAVHAAGIVHRDLKPANILLDRASQPFLTDFGLARAAGGEQVTLDGQFVGTPAYMAPEQASPELGAVGAGSDQYSLGVVLYEMLTGRRPFEGPTAALVFQVGSKPVPPPSQHRPDLDSNLERVLLKTLARQPQDRFGSVGEFAGALRAWKEPPAKISVQGPRAAQQRRVTLLSCGCDLFDSPAILKDLDPEEQHELLLEFQQLCREAAAPMAGTVIKATDRGLLICFGIPFALECAAGRAVRASLSLLECMGGLNERLGQKHKGLHLSARIGIHSDVAVVTEDSGRCEPLSIFGQVASVVDQLERLAEPDTIVISEDTLRLVRGFVEVTNLGTPKLQGAAGTKAIFRVHGEANEFCGCTSMIPLVGRDREVALLEQCWEQAVEGTGQFVLLVGEAGIGKSRQARGLKEHVAKDRPAGCSPLIIEWPCSLLAQNSSLAPATRCLARLFDLAPHEVPSEKLDKLAAHLEQVHLASAEAVALLASLLTIPLDDRYPALSMSPQRQKERTFDLLLDWLRAQAQRQPVLLVIEDLHWADSTTREFLDVLAAQAPGPGLLTLLTCRPEFVPSWKTKGHHTQVSLNRLSRRHIGELMLLKSGLPTIPPAVLDQVAERTDGVPLFVEEFTAMLLEAGGLSVADGAVQMSDSFDMHAIPATLQDLLMARLDRLTGNLEVVQLAATIGREFSYELLSAVVSCSEASLEQELAKLVEAELLFQQGRPPHSRYQFKHALIQDAAYQSLLKRQRQQFHVRIAEAFEQRLTETSAAHPELLAHHFTEGNALSKAVAYWERAGQRAQQRGAAAEAVHHFTRGLDSCQLLPATLERYAQEIQLHISLGVSLAAAKGFGVPELEATYARAHALCLQTGLTDQVFPALFGRLRYSLNRAMHAEAQELAEEVLQLAERDANAAYQVSAHCALGLSLLFQGQPTEACPHLERVVAVEATPELRSAVERYVLVDPWVSSHAYLSWALWLLGFPDRAAEHSRQALATAEQLGNPFSIGLALCDGSWTHWFSQDREKIRTATARALALGAEHGFVSLVAWARIVEAWAFTEPGQSEQALTAIHQGLEDLRAQLALGDHNTMLTLLADVCARAGRPEEGLQALDEALQFVDAKGESFFQAEILRLKGELLLQQDSAAVPQAETCFHLALEVAHRQQARSLELRAAMSLARLWIRQQRTAEALALLAPVYHGFTEGFQTHDLQQAKALLDQCQTAVAE